MKEIRLYGEMGKKFGREHHFDVRTPAEAVRALCSQIEGFKAYLHANAKSHYKVFAGGRNACDELSTPCSDKEIIRIAPVVHGAGAVGRIVVGIVLVIAAVFVPALAPYAAQIIGMGGSMILGGVAELLSPQAKNNSGPSEAAENTPSYNFNGAINTLAQGHPVPLAYGRIMAGSAVISAGITTL